MDLTVQQMKDHITSLGKSRKIIILDADCSPHDAICTSRWGMRVVGARTIADDTGYAIFLHEIGHHEAPDGQIRKNLIFDENDQRTELGLKIREELAAWEWAEQNTLQWTVGIEMVRRISVGTYTNELRRAYGF